MFKCYSCQFPSMLITSIWWIGQAIFEDCGHEFSLNYWDFVTQLHFSHSHSPTNWKSQRWRAPVSFFCFVLFKDLFSQRSKRMSCSPGLDCFQLCCCQVQKIQRLINQEHAFVIAQQTRLTFEDAACHAWRVASHKLEDDPYEAKIFQKSSLFPCPVPAADKGKCMLFESTLCPLQSSRSWMPFLHGKRHHRISLQQGAAGRGTVHAYPKEFCTWQTPASKHSYVPTTTHTSSSPGQIFQDSFQRPLYYSCKKTFSEVFISQSVSTIRILARGQPSTSLEY